ncbi:MAG: coat protein [Cressdnaviricota sp.]|nr:MAG: coat protein [Cressdnaviricota sp.]
MPMNRRYGKSSKKTFRRKRYTKKTTSVAYKALSLARTMRRQIEYKFHSNQPTRTLTTNGTVDNLSQIAEGDTSLTRTGLKVSPTSLLLKIRIRHGDDGATPPVLDPRGVVSRVIIVRDLQQEADTAPAVTDLLVHGTSLVMSPYSRLYRNRFEVLMDKTYKTCPNASNSVVYDTQYLKLSSKRPIYYNGGGSADLQKNGIYMFQLCDDAVYSPTSYIWWRMRFADL